MSNDNGSHRQILRSTSLMGGAAVVTYLFALIGTKVTAVVLGPSGVGQIGLLSNLMGICAGIAALGIGASGTRQFAEAYASGDQKQIANAYTSILLACVILGSIGGASVWLAREFIANEVIKNASATSSIGWLSLGVWLLVVASWPNAIITGAHRIGDVAAASIFSAITATSLAVIALTIYGADGMLAVVLAPPVAAFLIGVVLIYRLPRRPEVTFETGEIFAQWKILASLGGAYLIANLVQTSGYFAVRLQINSSMSAYGLGIFEAAWMISTLGIGILYKTTGSDFYPRLTSVVNDKIRAGQLLKEQTTVLLYLATPLILLLQALAAFAVKLIYSSNFSEAADLLRLFALGTFLRVIAYPFGYVSLALQHGRAYLFLESSATIAFVISIYFISSPLSFKVIGFSWFITNVIYLLGVYCYAAKNLEVSLRDYDLKYFLFAFAALGMVTYIAQQSELLAIFVGSLCAILSLVITLKKLHKLVNFDSYRCRRYLDLFLNRDGR